MATTASSGVSPATKRRTASRDTGAVATSCSTRGLREAARIAARSTSEITVIRSPRGRRGTAPAARRGLGRPGPAACGRGAAAGRREIEPGEGERLGQVGLALGRGCRPAGVDLDDDVTREALLRRAARAARAHGWSPRPGTRCSSRAEPVPSARCTWASRSPSAGHRQGVGLDTDGVREVEGDVPVVRPTGSQSGRYGSDLAAARPQRVHVLDREPDVGLLGHPRRCRRRTRGRSRAASGTAGGRRRSTHPSVLGGLRARARASPTGSVPHTRWVTSRHGAWIGEDRDAVVVGEPAQRVDVLADRVGPDHDLDAVVAEPRGELEGARRRLRIDRGGRQRDLRLGYPRDCHGPEASCDVPGHPKDGRPRQGTRTSRAAALTARTGGGPGDEG